MTQLIICRGLPGAGKTHRAKAWVSLDPRNRARVNRDDFRKMLHDGAWIPRDEEHARDTESQVVAARDATILALLRRGIDVVSDDTNLPQRMARDVAKLGRIVDADIEIWDMTNHTLESCIIFDKLREASVGEDVIRDKWERYIRGKSYPLPFPDEVGGETVDLPYVRPVSPLAWPAIIVDIDGTVALRGTRSPFDETRVYEDRPNEPVCEAVRAMVECQYKVIFLSGRTEGCRAETEEWIEEHVGVPVEHLYMRALGDHRNDAVVKLEIFNENIRYAYDIVCVFDDRQRVVDMWRSLGLTVMQVAPGDF